IRLPKSSELDESDTPLPLKWRGFLGPQGKLLWWLPSYRLEGLAGVPASTHKPQVVRHTILPDWRRRDLPWLTMRIEGKDNDFADHITVSAETTLPAGIDSAAWFVPMPAVWAGLTGVVFILKHLPYPFSLRLVRDIGPDFAMTPLANLLIALTPKVDAIGD